MKALYRRYRPLKLEDVVGQSQVTEPLVATLRAGKISHAYLFVGPRGCGKTSVARILAHEANGFPYTAEDDYVDIIEIDGASNRGIDNIRELREKAAIAPTMGKYKFYIIDEVHMLTKEAFNALLKTLEEPPEHVIFIMATTDAYKVPVTITSRAQTYTFKLADPEVMLGHLKSICEKEQIKIDDAALKIVVKRGGGSFRDSLSLLDQISTLSDGEITKDLVVSAMGLPEDEKITELLECYTTRDVVKITTVLKDLLSSGVKPETLVEEMISAILENPRAELMPLLFDLPEVKAPFAEARLLVALCGKYATSEPRPNAQQPGSRLTSAKQSEPHLDKSQQPSVQQTQDLPSASLTTSVAQGTEDAVSYPDASTNAPANNTETTTNTTMSDFDWQGFLIRVREMNDAVYSQLMKASYVVSGGTLNIYPEKKVAKMILSRDNNKKILIDAAGGMKIVIGEPGGNPNVKKDALISKISDIMGGEVQNDGGGNPF